MNNRKKQSVHYLNPRLGIFIVNASNKAELLQIQVDLKVRHKNYFHIFNLTSFQFGPQSSLGSSIGYTNFKWRQIPFSITQTIKLLASIQNYQTKNLANAAILAASDKNSYEFCIFVCQIYQTLLGMRKQKYGYRQHTISEFFKIYKSIDIKNPPVKIVQSLSFKHSQYSFIPIPKIYTEGRHNNLQQVYSHKFEQQLGEYYIDKKKPLNSGIGGKYCERRPQTKHFSKPVIVFGDVKIEVYSFDSFKLQRQFVCGFNTKGMQYDQTLIQLRPRDLYEIENEDRFRDDQQVIIQVADYCETCKDEAKCPDCLQIIKKIHSRYNECQIQLQRICRQRNSAEVKQLLGQSY